VKKGFSNKVILFIVIFVVFFTGCTSNDSREILNGKKIFAKIVAEENVVEEIIIKEIDKVQEKYPEAIPWDEAKYYVGEEVIIKGPMVNINIPSGVRGNPVFMDIGKVYPDRSRLSLVAWQNDWSYKPNFWGYLHEEVYIKGFVRDYKGVTQITIMDEGQIEFAYGK